MSVLKNQQNLPFFSLIGSSWKFVTGSFDIYRFVCIKIPCIFTKLFDNLRRRLQFFSDPILPKINCMGTHTMPTMFKKNHSIDDITTYINYTTNLEFKHFINSLQ